MTDDPLHSMKSPETRRFENERLLRHIDGPEWLWEEISERFEAYERLFDENAELKAQLAKLELLKVGGSVESPGALDVGPLTFKRLKDGSVHVDAWSNSGRRSFILDGSMVDRLVKFLGE